MRTRFSDLVFPIGEILRPPWQQPALFAVGAHLHPTLVLRSRPVHSALALPYSHLSTLAPPQPLFHHAVSKRPDHQLYTIMRPRLCHSGGQVSLHRRWL